MRNQERGREWGEEESSWRRRLAARMPFHDSRVPAPAPLGTAERERERGMEMQERVVFYSPPWLYKKAMASFMRASLLPNSAALQGNAI